MENFDQGDDTGEARVGGPDVKGGLSRACRKTMASSLSGPMSSRQREAAGPALHDAEGHDPGRGPA